MTRTGAYDEVLDALGGAIVAGELPPGHVESVEAIVARTGVSRSVVREAVRVLGAAGLLSASRRVGLRVQPASSWDTLNPLVVRWRLASTEQRAAQLDELGELRAAIEPQAAALAAARRSTSEAAELVAAAERLAAAGTAAEFLEADTRFHGLLLDCARNAMLGRLQSVVGEALRERALGRHPRFPPDPEDVALHAAVAQAVANGETDAAAALARELIARGGEDAGAG